MFRVEPFRGGHVRAASRNINRHFSAKFAAGPIVAGSVGEQTGKMTSLHGWFQPSSEGSTQRRPQLPAAQRMARARSGGPGRFRARMHEAGAEQVATEIAFDPLRSDMADKTVATADWPSMLDFVLKLNSRDAIQFGDLRSKDIAKDQISPDWPQQPTEAPGATPTSPPRCPCRSRGVPQGTSDCTVCK